jgi:hypothetical protein
MPVCSKKSVEGSLVALHPPNSCCHPLVCTSFIVLQLAFLLTSLLSRWHLITSRKKPQTLRTITQTFQTKQHRASHITLQLRTLPVVPQRIHNQMAPPSPGSLHPSPFAGSLFRTEYSRVPSSFTWFPLQPLTTLSSCRPSANTPPTMVT